MSTLQQLLEQQAALTKQIDATRRAERSAVVAKVKELMDQHGLTVADLGLKSTRGTGRGKVAAKYANKATGETWSGRGLKPRWLASALEQGRQLEEFLV